MRQYHAPINEPEGAEPAFFRAMEPVVQLATLFHLGRIDRGEHTLIPDDAIAQCTADCGENNYAMIDEMRGMIAGQITDSMMISTVQVMPKLQPYWNIPLDDRYAALRNDHRTLSFIDTADRAGAAIDRGEMPSGMIVSGIRVGVNMLVTLAIFRHHPSGAGNGIDAPRFAQILSGTDSVGLTLALNDIFIADMSGKIDQMADPTGTAGMSNAFSEMLNVRGAPGCPARKAVQADVVSVLEAHGFPVADELKKHSPIQSLGTRIQDAVDCMFDVNND